MKSTSITGHITSRGVFTRKAIAFTITIAAVCVLFNTAALGVTKNKITPEAAEQVLLRLLFHPAHDAINEYYGEPRQYENDRILSIQTVPDTSYYKVVLQVETFYGPHNPPYGIETMTFYVSYGNVELKAFDHKDEPTEANDSLFSYPLQAANAACFYCPVLMFSY